MIKKITDKTYYFDFGWICVPFYKFNDSDVVLLDSGLRKEGCQITDYLVENNLNPIAIIHSHIHDDHVNGDLCILERFDTKIFGSMIDVDASYEEYGFVKEVPPLKAGDVKDLFDMCHYMEKNMNDTSKSQIIDIYGEPFTLIPTPGHSTDHKMIITPDGVCYLGDVLMANNTLKRAKLPYSYHLKEDLESKESVLYYGYDYYIAAHDGYFLGTEIETIVKENINRFYGLIDTARDIFIRNTNITKEDASLSLQRAIGLRGHIGIPWVLHTVDEVFSLIIS